MLNKKGSALIGILIVILVIGLLFVYMSGGKGIFGKRDIDTNQEMSKTQKTTVYGQALDAGKAVECQSNIGQIRNSINMYFQTNEAYPESLEALNLPGSMLKCVVSGEAYVYDPQSGRVYCPTHKDF